jgi:prolyl oligopeptidase
VGSVRFDDPFRRLEDMSPAVLAWQAELHARAGHVLRRAKGFQGVLAAVEKYLRPCFQVAPARAGGRWFSLEPGADGTQVALWVWSQLHSEGWRVLHAQELMLGEAAGIDWYVPSPDGRYVAVGVSARGDEQSVLYLACSTGAEPPRAVLDNAAGGQVAWLPDSSGLYCCAGLSREDAGAAKELFHVSLWGRATRVATPDDRAYRLAVQVCSAGRYVSLLANPIVPRLAHILDRSTSRWLEGPPAADGMFVGVTLGSVCYAVTTDQAPRGRLVAAPVISLPDVETWREIVPEGSGVLRSVAASNGTLVLHEVDEGRSRIRVVSMTGDPVATVPLPADGVVGVDPRNPWYGATFPCHQDPEGISFCFSSLRASPRHMYYTFRTGELRPLTVAAHSRLGIECQGFSCRGSGPAPVRYEVVARAVDEADGAQRAALVVGYGGWNALTPTRTYPAALMPFIEAGGVVVLPHLRGEGTYGIEQWRDGRRRARQNSFDDLYSVVEDIVQRGLANQDRVAIYGASNGGLLVGAAITQRPELFAAAVAAVPLLDMARFVRERFAEHFMREYGDPRDPDDARALRSFSPYHNVSADSTHPPTLIVCGAADVRCHAWHGRKMAAALEHADRDVLLRVHENRGHLSAGILSPPELVAEWLTFVMHHVKLL